CRNRWLRGTVARGTDRFQPDIQAADGLCHRWPHLFSNLLAAFPVGRRGGKAASNRITLSHHLLCKEEQTMKFMSKTINRRMVLALAAATVTLPLMAPNNAFAGTLE